MRSFMCFWSAAVGMAWSSRSQVQGHRIRGEGSGSQEVHTGVSKIRAEVHADARRALLLVVRRRTQVPQSVLLQAARVAADFRGGVVAGGRGVVADHLLEGPREDGAGGARQAGESAGLGHRLAGSERQSLDGELRALTGGAAHRQRARLLVLVGAPAEPTLLHGFGPQVQRCDTVANCDGGWGHVRPHPAWPHPFIHLRNIHQLIWGTQIHCV